MDLNEQQKHWTAEARRQLQGRTIKDAVYIMDEEFEKPILVILLDNGTNLYPMQDDEGNGPGAIHVVTGSDFHLASILPTLSR